MAFERFVLYAGGDYTLYPNSMLLIQVMAYVMSGTIASDKVRHLTCAPESGPLIGSPIRMIRPGLGLPHSQFNLKFLKKKKIVNIKINQDNVNG